jgi:hypothetical protein
MGQLLPPPPHLPRLPNLPSAIRKRVFDVWPMRRDVASAASGDEHGQYGSGELGPVAAIGALQYRIDQGAVVVAGIKDLMQNPNCQYGCLWRRAS